MRENTPQKKAKKTASFSKEKNQKYRPTVIDLFCGCGGLSKGFLDAGFDVLLGVDSDIASINTYTKNVVGANGIALDVSDFSYVEKIKSLVQEKRVDVVVAGPPCQGFSLTGTRNFDDNRNKLYLAVIEAVRKLRPKAFVLENVKGMKTLYKGEVKNEIIKRFTELGYNVAEPEVLCAADYGVPQVRERLFFVGVRSDIGEFKFPPATHEKSGYVSCDDAIGDLPSLESDLGHEVSRYKKSPATDYQRLMRAKTDILYNHVATRHSEYVKSVIRLVPQGGNYKNLPPGVGESRKFNEAWTRYHGQRPSRTIDTGHRNHFHYKYDRVPTIRENARLQSFPDDFVFVGTKTQQNRQVGNAVPPMLAKAIATRLLASIGTSK